MLCFAISPSSATWSEFIEMHGEGERERGVLVADGGDLKGMREAHVSQETSEGILIMEGLASYPPLMSTSFLFCTRRPKSLHTHAY